jgi:esterase
MPLALAATEYGAGPPLAILHGLFGSGRNWASIAQRLAAHHRVIAFDLRNHGASPWAETMDYGAMAEDLRASLEARGHQRFALLGHSMGGKVGMVAALQYPESVERLIVADIAPVFYATRHLGEIQAMRRLDLARINRRAEADKALASSIPDAAERGFLLQNLLFENGGARWRLNLAAIEEEMPRLVGFPAIAAGRTYDGPALFIAGGRSNYLQPAHEPAIRRLFPHAEIARIDNAGHWLHAEQPAAFLAIVEAFLDRSPDS